MKKENFVLVALFAMCLWLAVPDSSAKDSHSGAASKPVTVVISHKVADFAAWEKVFTDHAAMREKGGCTGITVYQSTDDPSQVTTVGTFASAEQANAFFASEDLKAAMANAGVQGPPEIHVLNKHKEYPH